jgi:excisionase family DNA binding protein
MVLDSSAARPRFLTVAEVAEEMRVSGMTVYRLIHAGALRAVRVGRSFRVPEDAVEEFLAAAGDTTQEHFGTFG